jgi:transcriptional regulator with XRE-family HTH domain
MPLHASGMVKQVNVAQRRVGKQVRDLRLKRGWSQELLAAEAGLNINYLGGIERGERNPSLKNLAKIADAMGLTVPDLVEPLRN